MQDNQNMAENFSGGETASADTPFADNETTQDGFLDGFSGEDNVDEQTEQGSDSTQEELNGDTDNNQKHQEEQSGRPDKRSRSNERIQQLLSEKRKTDAELAEYREWKSKQNQPKLEYDENGNVSVEDMQEYNRQLIQQEIERSRRDSEAKIQSVEREKNLDNSISTIEGGIKERVQKYDFLNPESKNFNEQISKNVTESVLDRVKSLQLSGFDDFTEMANMALEEVDRQLELINIASQQASIRTAGSISRMQSGGAISSSNHGMPAAQKDDFLDGFNN
jgi:hypothetical protein